MWVCLIGRTLIGFSHHLIWYYPARRTFHTGTCLSPPPPHTHTHYTHWRDQRAVTRVLTYSVGCEPSGLHWTPNSHEQRSEESFESPWTVTFPIPIVHIQFLRSTTSWSYLEIPAALLPSSNRQFRPRRRLKSCILRRGWWESFSSHARNKEVYCL
jgi:hypothetical protein